MAIRVFFKVGDIESVFVLLVLDRVVSTILVDPDEETMPGDFHFETVVDWESIWGVCVA
tara:strand:- start:140 stop:316 length:177 start_codon:yes stop_codon:yes gene_type:complete